VLQLPRPDRAGLAFFLLLAGLVVWSGLSIVWSVEPDRSWEYFNRGLVYVGFAVVGLLLSILPRAMEAAAGALTILFGAVVLWALAGKVVPDLFPDGERVARLRDPLGYWNALALVAGIAMLLGSWVASRPGLDRRLRTLGPVVVFVATVALLLTYSRGGALVAAIVLLVYVLLAHDRLQVLAALALGVIAGVAVTVWAFTQDGIASDRQPYDTRLADGLQLGVALVLVAALVGAAAMLLLRYEASHADRLWRPSRRQWSAAAGGGAVVAVVAVLVVSGGDPAGWARRGVDEFTSPTVGDASTAARFGKLSSNSRWDWWVESWDVFKRDPAAGAGAGAFDVARRPFRRNIIVVVEPHSLPVQFLAETGIVGLALLLATFGAGVAASIAGVRRLRGAERGAATVLALAGLGYLLHALVDYDWDFVGLTGPALLIVGLLAGVGRPLARAAPRRLAASAAVLLALAGLFSLAAPWLASRSVADAYAALERRDLDAAAAGANDARDLNPLSIEPLSAAATVAHARGDRQRALELYAEAVELQPENWRSWHSLARYEEGLGLDAAAIRHATRAQQLDPLHPALGPLLELLYGRQ